MLIRSLQSTKFNCSTDYALSSIDFVNLDRIKSYFGDLPVDPYIEGKFRYRRLSHFGFDDENRITKLPHRSLFQSTEYNPLLGNVIRDFAELDDGLIELSEFQRILLEFFEYCKVCSTYKEVAVHQIRTTASANKSGNPAPEGIHRDGVDLIGIFSVNRDSITGGETELYKSKNSSPLFTKVLDPGELLVFNDNEFFHYTSPIQVVGSESGSRDVFVFTCPGLVVPER